MYFFYPLFFIVSILVPRDKTVWAFGHYEKYKDNTKYFFEYASAQKEYRCYWLANNTSEMNFVKGKGFNSVLKNSFRGYWVSSRAYLTFICTGFNDVNRLLALYSNVINFWHGTPIKKIFSDVQKISKKPLTKCIGLYLRSRIKCFFLSNSLEGKIIEQAAGLHPKDYYCIGSPRLEMLQLSEKYRDFPFDSNKKIFLYAPTWRDSDSWSEDFRMTPEQYLELNKKLKQSDAILLIKQHPLTDIKKMQEWGIIESEFILYADSLGVVDVNELLPNIDLLITDISSIIFDFLIFNKPVLLFMPDSGEYLKRGRGVYDYFKEELRTNSLDNWNDLIDHVGLESEHYATPFETLNNELSSLVNINHNIYEEILKRFYA